MVAKKTKKNHPVKAAAAVRADSGDNAACRCGCGCCCGRARQVFKAVVFMLIGAAICCAVCCKHGRRHHKGEHPKAECPAAKAAKAK
ncbi:MAG: hypothetical protein LBH41_00080 [Rickettsiales bacterium]|nr:hypothetical protein [Rickettsiales bacterium]